MKASFFFLLAGFTLLIACRKQEFTPAPVTPTDTTSVVKIRWQKPLTPDTAYGIHANAQFVSGNQIIYNVNFTVPTATVQARNAETGELNWIFDDFIRPVDAFLEQDQILKSYDVTLINASNRVYCLSNSSGHLLWSSDVSDKGAGYPFATVIGDYLYTGHYSGFAPAIQSTSVVRTHYLSGQWDTLVTFASKGDSFFVHLPPPVLWVNPEGDSILLFSDRQSRIPLDGTGKTGRLNLYAFNLRTKQILWEKIDIDPGGSTSGGHRYISGNRAFILSSNIVHCIDLNNGQTLWQRDIPGGCYAGSVVEYDGAVIVQSMAYGMWALDKETGATKWHNPDTDGAAFELTLFDGVVYFTSSGYGLLYAIDAETGKTLWKTQTPSKKSGHYPDASFSFSGLAIDEQRRLLFVADGYFLFCFELPPK